MTNPDFLLDRIAAQQQADAQPVDPNNDPELRSRIKSLGNEEKNLLAALRTAPSATEGIGRELEKVAAERKRSEAALAAKLTRAGGSGDSPVNPEAVRAFAANVSARLRTLDVAERHRLLALLGFAAVVTDTGDVKASIAVPTVTPGDGLEKFSPTGRTWA